MLTCVGGCGPNYDTHVSVRHTCSTQNVRSATMGEAAAFLTAQVVGRMLLVLLLVWGYCLTGCQGVLHHQPPIPALTARALDSAGRLDTMTKVSDVSAEDDALLSHLRRQGETGRQDGVNYFSGTNGKDRVSSLRRLLQHLDKLQEDPIGPGSNPFSPSASDKEVNKNLIGQTLNKLSAIRRESHSSSLSEPLYKVLAESPAPFKIIAQLELLLASSNDHVLPISISDWWDATRDRSDGANDKQRLILDGTMKQENNDLQKVTEASGVETVEKTYPDLVSEQLSQATSGRSRATLINDLPVFFQSEKDDLSPISSSPIDRQRLLSSKLERSGMKGSEEFDMGRRRISRQTEGDFHSVSRLLDSLIRETVTKMEHILQKREQERQFVDIEINDFKPRDGSLSPDDQFFDADSADSLHSSQSAFPDGDGDDEDNFADEDYNDNANDKFLTKKREEKQHADQVTAAVIAAVTSQTLPKDAQFWRNISSYLDSSLYLSRTRRSSKRYRIIKNQVSITYGHVVPCQSSDIFYCMNGGTCVYVNALDIKTCRCPIGYTGVRCEMIDQEYILSLLTNSIIFS